MPQAYTLAAEFPFLTPILIGTVIVIVVALFLFFVTRYKRCPSNRVLVVFGKVGGDHASKCIHGGGTMVWPIIQDYHYLSLEPITIDIDLQGALSQQNIRVNVPSTFTIGISTRQEIMLSAAERLLGLTERDIATQANDIIFGQLRLVIATLTIEQINQDRENFLELILKNVGLELNKIGLDVINVNIRDITDESGYINAIGQKAASEAVNKAKVEVAEANRTGEIGQATAEREQEIVVAQQLAQAESGRKEAERDKRIAVSKFEAEGVKGEVEAKREQEVATAAQAALTVEGRKKAEAEQRIQVASLEADAVKGENESKASIAEYEATLDERQADAKRRGEVALANSERDVLIAEKEAELARLEKEQIAQQMIERQKVEIDAEAEAEKRRRIAKGDADAILAKYKAEAEGIQAVLDAKATGYHRLLESCEEQKYLAPTLLMVEKMPELVREQVKAIQNLKIDKITVWDSGKGDGEGRSTANFLSSLIGSLPAMHDLASQAGVELPEILGTVNKGGNGSKSGSASGGVKVATKPDAVPDIKSGKTGDKG